MGNYGVKLRKPEELPDFDQPIDYEEEKKRFEPVKVEEQNDKESHIKLSYLCSAFHTRRRGNLPISVAGIFMPVHVHSIWRFRTPV